MKQPNIKNFFVKWNYQLKREGFHHPSKCKFKTGNKSGDCFCVKCEPLIDRDFGKLTLDELEGFKDRILGGWEYI